MRKLSFEEMENVKGGGRSACFAAMGDYLIAMVGLTTASNNQEYALAGANLARAFIGQVSACGGEL